MFIIKPRIKMNVMYLRKGGDLDETGENMVCSGAGYYRWSICHSDRQGTF